MKRPDEVTEFLRCGGENCDGACSSMLDRLGVEDCKTWRVHGYVQQLEERIVHLESLNQQNLSVITMQERTRARMQEQISEFESRVPRWISVEERLPEDNETVMLFYSATKFVGMGCLDYDFMEWYGMDGNRIARPDCWMPLPEPPKEATRD